jgi:ATP phosphoribosyltransferase
MTTKPLRIALPSDGALYESTLEFMKSIGTPIERARRRRYVGSLSNLEESIVLFQRASDIPLKIEDRTADIGIVGKDRFLESKNEFSTVEMIIEDLEYGKCELVFAVPEQWIDVTSLEDLAELAIDFKQNGLELTVVTKYPKLVQQTLLKNGIQYVTLVHSSGTLEAAPAIGSADFIADLTETGTTLRENQLKLIEGGSILNSQACLIANINELKSNQAKLKSVKTLLERIEAYIRAQSFVNIVTSIKQLNENKFISELTKSDLVKKNDMPEAFNYSEKLQTIDVSLIVHKSKIVEIVSLLRSFDSQSITINKPVYLFTEKCEAYDSLIKSMEAQ